MNLLVLWDPENPIVPAGSVVEALRKNGSLQVDELTFAQVGHRTLPNRAFRLRDLSTKCHPDGILWIEGGPLPRDLGQLDLPRAAWIPNSALEGTMVDAIRPEVDRVFVGSLRDTAEEKADWLPASADEVNEVELPGGVSVLLSDPRPPSQVRLLDELEAEFREAGAPERPLVLCLGNGGLVHPKLFDCLRMGAAVVTDSECDLRGIAHVGEHLEVLPREGSPSRFLKDLAQDRERLKRLSTRGPAIYGHLHEPSLRAERIVEGLWPRRRILSGEKDRPRVSILVTCYRYLRRLSWCLESLARQTLPEGSIEIVVADPGSPDGLAAHLERFAKANPGLRVIHLPIDSRYHRNRGVGINRAFDASSAPVVIAIDGDLVFPPHLLALLEERVTADPAKVFGIRRAFLRKEETERILEGGLDPFSSFQTLSTSSGDGEEKPFVGVLGYCQAVHRRAFAKARYPEEFDMVNQSDIVFVERLRKEAGVTAEFLGEETALHLWHPRNWMGTTESL